MHVALFIPCYIDQFFPDVGIATVEVLQRYGVEAEFPKAQTCCGQPMSNTGCFDAAVPLAKRFLQIFQPYSHVVCPSGSCTAMVRHHYRELLHDADPSWQSMLAETEPKVFELCEFLHDVIKVDRCDASFPARVSLHASCHGLRELRLGPSSETRHTRPDKVGSLLKLVRGIELVSVSRPDECCGFGGTFAVTEEAVSALMGRDRIADHVAAGADVMAAADMSCLMHLEGLIRRDQKPLRVMHVAQILAGRPVPRTLMPHTPVS
jgi:L-lactate dehydrogenase complex protein LldE